jgi:drug/metabolite transporter (DMT)-like permease
MAASSIFIVSIIFGLLAMLGYGVTDFFSSVITKRDNAVRVTFWYFLISGVALAIGALVFFQIPQISAYEWILLAITSVFSAAGLITFYRALRIGKLSIVAPISSAWSIVPFLAGALLLGEPLGIVQVVGILVVIIGTVLASFSFKELKKMKLTTLAPGAGYAIATLLIWGVFYTTIGVLSKEIGWIYAIAIVTLGSALAIFLFSFRNVGSLSFPRKIWWLIGLWILVGTAALIIYGVGTQYGYISVVGPLAAAAPIVAVAIARVILKERLTLNEALGIALIIIGVLVLAF